MKTLTLVLTLLVSICPLMAETPAPDVPDLLKQAVQQLVAMQESDGAWPYEGVYRVKGEIPIGYRVGGTALVCEALLHGASANDSKAQLALVRGTEFVLKGLEHPLMQSSRDERYDVRVWGQAFALEFLCQTRAADRAGDNKQQIDAGITKLVESLIIEELSAGGWNYASRRAHASFVTGPITQALLLARSQGEKVPNDLLARCREVLQDSRLESGAFFYSGTSTATRRNDRRAKVPGSIARSPLCESTLLLLGSGSHEAILNSLNYFHRHWSELEKRRAQPGTHVGEYGIAPYYFYFGHRYAAQAIELLPASARDRERRKLRDVVLRTRQQDGTWNDRVFPRSRNYGTAMSVLALLQDRTPLPPPLTAAAPASTVDPKNPSP